MKSYSSREILEILKKDGWYEVGCDGDHHQFKHPSKAKLQSHIQKKIFPPEHLRVFQSNRESYFHKNLQEEF